MLSWPEGSWEARARGGGTSNHTYIEHARQCGLPPHALTQQGTGKGSRKHSLAGREGEGEQQRHPFPHITGLKCPVTVCDWGSPTTPAPISYEIDTPIYLPITANFFLTTSTHFPLSPAEHWDGHTTLQIPAEVWPTRAQGAASHTSCMWKDFGGHWLAHQALKGEIQRSLCPFTCTEVPQDSALTTIRGSLPVLMKNLGQWK